MIGPASHIDVSADTAVKVGPGQLVAVLLTPASAASSITLYDDPDSTDGTVLVALTAVADGASVQFTPAVPYVFSKGCYADISGSGANATVVVL